MSKVTLRINSLIIEAAGQTYKAGRIKIEAEKVVKKPETKPAAKPAPKKGKG